MNTIDPEEISDLIAVRLRLERMLHDFFQQADMLLFEIDRALDGQIIPVNKEQKVTAIHSPKVTK